MFTGSRREIQKISTNIGKETKPKYAKEKNIKKNTEILRTIRAKAWTRNKMSVLH